MEPLKPSEAILEGIKWWPNQAFGVAAEDKRHAACAYTGALRYNNRYNILSDLWTSPLRDPVSHRKSTVVYVVIHLNDGPRWSREKIAAWLAKRGL